jgi:hypothetical protein
MRRIFCITQPNVISLITTQLDDAEVFSPAMILGKVAMVLRTGPGWVLYCFKKEAVNEVQTDPSSIPVGGDPSSGLS